MEKPSIFMTRHIGEEAVSKLQKIADLNVWSHPEPPDHLEIIKHAKQSDILITMLTDQIDRAVIDSSSKLKLISQMAVGYDNIEVAYATQKNIPVGHTPDVLTETTADFAWALLLSVSRRVVESHNEVQNGIWKPWGPFVWTGQDVNGSTLGIIGLGRIGQAVARRAMGFNIKTLYFSRQRKPELEKKLGIFYADFETLLKESDFISLHTALTKETHQLINMDSFMLMKPNAILINTARGQVVDQRALFQALKTGMISGAGLDVSDPEPINQDDPLLNLPNVVITPHIASASQKTRKTMALMMVENVIATINNEPIPYCVNPAVYD